MGNTEDEINNFFPTQPPVGAARLGHSSHKQKGTHPNVESQPSTTRGLLTPSILQDYPPLHPCSPQLCGSKGYVGFLGQKSPALEKILGTCSPGSLVSMPKGPWRAEANTSLVFAAARLHSTEEPKRQHKPSTFSEQTSEKPYLPGEIIKETKKRQGGIQTAWFQLRRKPTHFQSRR